MHDLMLPETPDPRRRINALILDDDEHDRSRFRRFSNQSQLSIDLHEEPTIERMAVKLEQQCFDLIIVDYNLTDGDGLMALEQIKRSVANRASAIVMITGDSQPNLPVRAFRQGCHDFISKEDLSPGALQETVLSAMRLANERMSQVLMDRLQPLIFEAINESFHGDAFKAMLDKTMNEALRGRQEGDAQMPSEGISDFYTSYLADYKEKFGEI